ncbi:unnamed protein product [Cuscuta epithymum]|uniref:Sodium/calcium exchanger membrane region domain-containing protein n=1 Tax=Cuscuta epithymum TaxID=186058 RepID=A0AAV0DHK2_9ASTE|nr:unnamed protein product [Cuscuta epithymum]
MASAAAQDQQTAWLLENGNIKLLSKEMRHGHGQSYGGRTAHNMSSSSLRKKSDLTLVKKVRCGFLRDLLISLQEVFLGTKLSILFVAIPFAILAQYLHYQRPWVFALSLLGLIPLAERISFLTEQIAFYTGPTVGGLLNATCGNATELIIAIFALVQNKVDVVKYSLLGSILSNLLLVLGTSLLCGGIANISHPQNFDRKQADVNFFLLLLGLLCHVLPMMFLHLSGGENPASTAQATLALSRTSCIVMILAYIGYLVFQLWTHRQLFDAQDEDGENGSGESEEEPLMGFWSSFISLVLMTAVVALLSEFAVGNAAEHAGAIIFAFKNKLDISLGVALGSATQIGIFVIPLTVIVAWIVGIKMDLAFSPIETGALALSIIITAFTLQDGTSHYIKGLVLLLCYIVIGASFFVTQGPPGASQPLHLRPNHGILGA